MPLTKEQKENIVSTLEKSIEKKKSIVFVGFDGVNVKEMTEFRETLKNEGGELKVAKKNLMKIALENKNIKFDPRNLEGEVAMVFGYEDEIVPSKLSYDFSKKNEKIKILGGFLEDDFYEKNDVIKLAQLPNKKQLLGMLVGTLNAPVTNLVGVLSGNTRGLVFALSQIRDQKA